MLSYLRDDLFDYVVPLLEKAKDSMSIEENKSAEDLIMRIHEKIGVSNSAFDICNWYGVNNYLRKEVSRFVEHKNAYVAEFGCRVEWLLTKGPYFYTDD